MRGQEFGRYVIQWEIGRGGMATVHLAYDPAVNRQVAIKILPRSMASDPEFKERFQREAEVVAALEHPNITPIYDYGEHDEQPYIVMRYMPGGSLASRIKRRPMSVEASAHLIERMAEALKEAHRLQIVHRDFKPENILYDQREESYLTDFGIVRILTGSGAITDGTIAGTPAYMAPEQVHGDETVDARADVYSMGVTLYEMLIGEPPYQAEQSTKLMMKHVLDPVPSILAANPDMPEGVEQVIQTAMAKNPDDRYQTPMEMSDALASVGRQLLSRRARRRLTSDDVTAMYDAISQDDDE